MSRFYSEIFFPYLEANDIKTVFQLGDVFDRRKGVNFLTLHMARTTLFDPLREAGIEFHAPIGNHDSYFKNTLKVDSLRLLLGEYDNVKVYAEPQTTVFDGQEVLVLPWICEDNAEVTLAAIKTSRARYVFAHLELAGFEMDRGNVCKDGMPASAFRKFEKVFTGHFHTQSKRDNIHYIGTAYEMSWSDYGETKGFHILDTETGETEFVANPFKLHHKIIYDDAQQTPETLTQVVEEITKTPDVFVKLIVKNKQNPTQLEKFIGNLEQSGAHKVDVIDDRLALCLDEDNSETAEGVEDTLAVLLSTFGSDGQIEDIPLEEIKDFVTELYVEAEHVIPC